MVSSWQSLSCGFVRALQAKRRTKRDPWGFERKAFNGQKVDDPEWLGVKVCLLPPLLRSCKYESDEATLVARSDAL